MRIAVFGLGRMAKVHARALRQVRGLKLVGGFDLDQTRVADFSNEYGVPCYSSNEISQGMSDLQPTGLIFATTSHGRASLVEQAIETTTPDWILLEKPFSTSLDEGLRLERICSTRGIRLGVNHQMRYMPHYLQLEEAVASGKFGALRSLAIVGSNFGLVNNGSHFFELFRFLTGSFPSKFRAELDDKPRPSHRGEQFLDYSGRVFCWNDKGVRLDIDFSSDLGSGVFIVANFELGKIFLDDITGDMYVAGREQVDAHLPSEFYGRQAYNYFTQIAIDSVLEQSTAGVLSDLAENTQGYPGADVGIEVVRSISMCIVSSMLGGGEVSLPLEGESAAVAADLFSTSQPWA